MYAVVRTAGKQYRVEEGALITVTSNVAAEPGAEITLDDVLLVADDGAPREAKGAKVTAEIVSRGKGEKIRVFRYKNKTRQRKTIGHRAKNVTLRITKIEV